MPDTTTFSGWFRDQLQRRGKTYAEAAEELGVSCSTTWQWAHQKRAPKGANLLALSEWSGEALDALTRKLGVS